MGKAVIFPACTEFIEDINLCLESSSPEFALIAYLYANGSAVGTWMDVKYLSQRAEITESMSLPS